MKYTVEIGSDAKIYITDFINIGSGTQKLIRGNTKIQRNYGNLISLCLFFKIRKVD
jgi:hypothetical protein